jgi:hypothetical protein
VKVTKFGPGGLPLPVAGWSTGGLSLNSNVIIEGGGLAALNFVQGITAEGSNMLTRPIANFAAGSNIWLTLDSGPGGSVPSNTIRIHTVGAGMSLPIAASNVSVSDAGAFFAATDVETALQELASKDLGYTAHGNTGATETFSSLVGWHSATLNSATVTFTFTGPISGLLAGMVLELAQDGTGGRLVTWPASVVWPGGTTPTLSTGAAAVDIFTFFSRDGGTTWYGFSTGGGSTFATPAIVLGTAAAAGAATTTIRSDSTIVAFDATVPVTQAFGDAAATGSVAKAARRDHVHGMPATPAAGGVGPLLITDTPAGSPLIFADLLQNEAGTDLLYADA